MKHRIYYTMCFSMLLIGLLQAQTRVEVVTKTIEDQFVYIPQYTLEVEGNSATITIQSWDSKEVKIIMKLISKGLTKAIATKELDYQKYVIDKINNTHVIRNYLLLPRDLEELSTIQETVIELWVPKNLKLHVKNTFGETRINNLAGSIEIDNKYGDLILENINSTILVNSTFGDLYLNEFTGNFEGVLQHTAFKGKGFSGKANIKTKLGDVHWADISNVQEVYVSAEQSNVTIEGLEVDHHYWQLKTKYGMIQFPKGTGGAKKMIYGNESHPQIEVSTDFGEIVIRE